jgi:hypothetical protein
MSKRNVYVSSRAFAYYFLQHNYRKNLTTNFEHDDLVKFASFFFGYANTQNLIVLDENGNVLNNLQNQKNFAKLIVDKYSFPVEKNNRTLYNCFKISELSQMREAYLNSRNDFMDLVTEYETLYIEEAYTNESILKQIEDECFTNSSENLKAVQKYTKEKGFDA